MKDFFISYNKADLDWATWIAWTLENAGHSVIIQAWDFRPGSNFVLNMQRALEESDRMVIVLSDNYLKASFTSAEWAAYFAADPEAKEKKLLPVRVRECKPAGLLGPLVYVDLLGLAKEDAKAALLGALRERAKPSISPTFPGGAPSAGPTDVSFPGPADVESKLSKVLRAVDSGDHSAILPLSVKSRLDLIKRLNTVPVGLFNVLLFAVNPPAGSVRPMPISQSERSSDLLNWAEGPSGCGLATLNAALEAALNPYISPADAESPEPDIVKDKHEIGPGVVTAEEPNFYLSEDSLQRGFNAISYHGYSDFFPKPPELAAVEKGWPELCKHLSKLDLTKYIPFRPVFAFAPKSIINLRPVVLLHPVDLIVYTSLVADMVHSISIHRASSEIAFSFRAEEAPSGALYAPRPSHAEFESAKLKQAEASKDGYMGFADIADFYVRLDQRKVREALDGCVAEEPNLSGYPGVIERLVHRLTPQGLSYGIPIGPAASRPIAEASLIAIDDSLSSYDIRFIRYIDDFVLFAPTREKVEWGLRTLGELLDKRLGLSLHSAKTKVMKCSKFLERSQGAESVESLVEQRFSKLIEDHFYDRDDFRSLEDLKPEEKEALDAVDLEKILEEALDEDIIDYKRVAFILDQLSSLKRQDLVGIVLNCIPRLYPVAHAVHGFFRNSEPLEILIRQQSGPKLLAPILASADERAPEFYAIWILDLFRFNPQWDQAASLAKIFRDTPSQAIRRFAALAISSSGSRSEALELKDAFQSSEPLTRSALLEARSKLGQDERKYWIRQLTLDWFEQFLLRDG